MNIEKDDIRIPLGLRARTLDFYVAFLVLFFGLSGFIDPSWPEKFGGTPAYWIVFIEDIYLIFASLIIMLSLIIREKKRCRVKVLVPSIIGEMFGWLFISAASWVIVLTAFWIPPSAVVLDDSVLSTFLWVLVWLGLGVSSFFRYLDLRKHYGVHR